MKTIRLFLFFLVGFLFSAVAVVSYAAVVPLRLPSNVGGAAGSYYLNGPAAFSGAAFNAGLSASVSGNAVPIPATFRLAPAAANAAVAAVRLNPGSLIGGAVAAWLLEKGLRYANDKWQSWQDVQGDGYLYAQPGYPDRFRTLAEFKAHMYKVMPYFVPGSGSSQWFAEPSWTSAYGVPNSRMQICLVQSSACWFADRVGQQSADWVDATEADFQRAAAVNPLPDPVANELGSKNVRLPLQNPQVSPTPQRMPMSDPYYDPVTKKWYRDILTVTPGADGSNAQAEPSKEEVDENGDPVEDESGNPVAPEEQTDHCKQNPDSLGCMNVGEPEDTDLKSQSVSVSINPVWGFGADNAACPVDESANLKMAGQVAFSYAPVCKFATSMRPVVIGFAWLSAALIFMGIVRRQG